MCIRDSCGAGLFGSAGGNIDSTSSTGVASLSSMSTDVYKRQIIAPFKDERHVLPACWVQLHLLIAAYGIPSGNVSCSMKPLQNLINFAR